MKIITTVLIGALGIIGSAYAVDSNTYYDGIHLSECTSKYINVYDIDSFNYQDGAWKLVMKNGGGGVTCALTVSSECRSSLVSVMGQAEYTNASVEGVLSNALCACDGDGDCVTGFRCSKQSGYKYGFCTQIANFCTTNSQCDMDMGYLCVNKACTQKCYLDSKPDDTDWKVVTKTSDMYQLNLIEKSTSYTCKQSGSSYAWTATDSFRCAKNAYGNPTSASSGCNICPDYPGPATSPAGTTSITGCYIPNGTQYGDKTGSYTLKGDCHYVQ